MIIALVFSWILWVMANLPLYSQMSGWPLVREILSDFVEQAVEVVILLELSLLYIRVIVRIFWNKETNIGNLILQVTLLAVFNGFTSALMALAYSRLFPSYHDLFFQIIFTDYIGLSVLTTAYLVKFLVNRYRDELEVKLRSEKELAEEKNILLQTRLKNLSLQTDNHFIFNCFSVLSSLIKTDPDKAGEFLQKLSESYRYLVINGGRDVVPLEAEMSFVRSYLELVRYRYSGISCHFDPALDNQAGNVCPMSIQGLAENAVKHNRHGRDNLLDIDIRLKDGYDVMTNNRLPREDSVPGTTSGLTNLKKRYSLLTEREVVVRESPDFYEVGVPILYSEEQEDESADH